MLPPLNTPGRRWRYRRNLVIYAARRQGVPLRALADVFDMDASRVRRIVRAVAELEAPDGKSPPAESSPRCRACRCGGARPEKVPPPRTE